MKVKIIGAGSIGNHLAQASRRMGWDVVVQDLDQKALERMKNEIYPKRYGAWDKNIQLFLSKDAPKGGFDIIFVGTPPDVRMKVALDALKERPRILFLEKPLCKPSLEGVSELTAALDRQPETIATVGYDHTVAESIREVTKLLKQKIIGEVLTIDVEFREHWRGILSAHPWLRGPQDTYLGSWEKGGGASGEHSHALNLWQYLTQVIGWGKVKEVSCLMDIHKLDGSTYDAICALSLFTEAGKMGRAIQDVITYPVKKWSVFREIMDFLNGIVMACPKET